MKKALFFILSIAFIAGTSEAQTTVTITADKDNTLYQSGTGALSNGSGIHLFFGKTQGGSTRRALIHFDLSVLPTNATISSATLNINVNRTKGGTDSAHVHLVNADWGEGTSNAGNSRDGDGTAAATGDATWVHRFRPNTNWSTTGGDFAGRPSASNTVSGNGLRSFTSAQMATDVQGWADGTVANNGWIILGNEGRNGSAKRMISRNSTSSTQRPTLVVTYLTTGITENETSTKIQVYPIPAQDYVVIEHRRNMFTNDVRVYDTGGKLVLDESLGMDNKLNVQDLKTGIYFLELETKEGNNKVTKKFVKQ